MSRYTVAFLFCALPQFGQSYRIAGVDEPPELTGEPKNVTNPPEFLKDIADVFLKLAAPDMQDNGKKFYAR